MKIIFESFKPKFINEFYKRLNLKKRKCIDELLEYNLFGGKFTRSLLTLTVINEFERNYTDDDIFLSNINEIIQASFIIFDDIMDKAEIRRGKECWYKVKGFRSVKDAFFLLSCARKLLGDEFKAVFDIMVLRSCLGQTHDSLCELMYNKTKEEIKEFYSKQNYKLICLNKNCYYTFYFPIKLGLMALKRNEDPELMKYCIYLGELHQMQDDYLNFLPGTNKSCLDVQQKKATWFMCKFVEKCDIFNFYNEAALERNLRSFINDYFMEEKRICLLIQEYCNISERGIILKCLDLLYKRKN